jgi:sodium-dependent dicarboxylate transporter 2/3/5
VLLLFGGGLALSEVMSTSGASPFLAAALTDALQGAPTVLLLLGVVAFVVFLTELVSNTASAALLVPIFVGVAATLGLPPPLFAAAIAVSASCAFMLPVATPPNALVYATEQVSQTTMMRCGLVLNLVCMAVITAMATALLT